MILFTIKKAFFDMWDNLIYIFILNIGFVVVLCFPVFVPYAVAPFSPILAIITLIIGILLFFLYAGVVNEAAKLISDYKSVGFKEFPAFFQRSWKTSLVIGGIYSLFFLVLTVGFPVYGSMNNLFGLVALVFLFWTSVIWILASQYYFPVVARLDSRIKSALKKSFLLMFDNTAFTIFLGIVSIIIAILSIFTALVLPGLAGVLLFINVGFKLRLYKYDYLEEHPNSPRNKIPWDALIFEDKERVGKRTLKGMIFPWKE